jgi:rod shape-determining protein MreC
MLNFRKGIIRNPQLIPLTIATFVSAVLIMLPLDLRTTVSRVGTLSLLYPYSELDRYLRRIDSTFKNNRELNRQLDSLTVLVSRLIENKAENDRLRTMLGFSPHSTLRPIPAEVVAISFGYPYKSMLINAGTERNIGPNMPVISPAGIVGKTLASGYRSATVQLLYDPACKVAARIQASRAQGIITYAGGNYLTMRDVPVEESALVGDSVVTSGLGGIFPEGLFIGIVVKTESKESGLFRDIKVMPGADMAALDEVFVLPATVIPSFQVNQ